MDLVIVTFDRPETAERAVGDARDAEPDAAWLQEFALVERRHNGRIVLRGTFAGRYVDVDEGSDAMGPDTAIGALTGAVVGAVFGWFGFAAGLVAGGSIGGLMQAEHVAAKHDALFDEIRAQVPAHGSAVILLAAPEHVDSLLRALLTDGGHAYRRSLSQDELATLEAAVSSAPAAKPAPREPLTSASGG
jgi:uncharacterized membrane protein